MDDKKKVVKKPLVNISENNQLNEAQIAFARELVKLTLVNTSKNTPRTSVSFGSFTKDTIEEWLKTPTSNERNIRNASIALYIASPQYQRLIHYYAGILLWHYVITPLNFDKKKVQEDNFRKQYVKVQHICENMNLPTVMRDLLIVTLREGVFYGVRWTDKNSSFIQKINPNYCQITAISGGTLLYSVDMSQIGVDKLEYYAPEFKDMYSAYRSTGVKYQEVPHDISVCLKADTSILEYTVPPFAGVMPSLFSIAESALLDATEEANRNYKMIAGEVQLDKEGVPQMGIPLVKEYIKLLKDSVAPNVGIAVAPFKLNSFDFAQRGGLADINNTAKATQNFWMAAGTSALLHGMANDKAGVVKLAIKNDETYVFGMMRQAENIVNHYLKTGVSGTVKFKIEFLPITVFNQDEYIKKYKESVAFGIGKLHYISALGIPQHDIEGLSYMENEILKLSDTLSPLKNTHNSGAAQGEAGRVPLSDDELDDEGENTRGNESNEDR